METDILILGSGMAGLTAAIYAARAGLKPVLIAGFEEGGQLSLTTMVENYPGFPEGILGPELTARMAVQAEKFGTAIIHKNAQSFRQVGRNFEIKVEDETIHSRAVIIATGASVKWLGLPSEKKYIGRGVSGCATCDAFFYRGKDVVVVGGGDAACEEADYLTKFAEKVTIIHRRDALRASKIMQERVMNNPKISFKWNSVVTEILGDANGANAVAIQDTLTGNAAVVKCDGVFIAIGHNPNTEIFAGIDLDDKGFIITDKRGRTNIAGVFAAGDVQDPLYKQAITAAGSGCQAALEAERYLTEK